MRLEIPCSSNSSTEFISSTIPDHPRTDDSDEGCVCFSNLPTILVDSVVQKTKVSSGSKDIDIKHRSWFKSTPFVLEITKYEYFDVKILAQSVPNGVQVTLNRRPLDERVGAALFDPRWQSLWA